MKDKLIFILNMLLQKQELNLSKYKKIAIDSSTPVNDDITAIDNLAISEGETVSRACTDGRKFIVKIYLIKCELRNFYTKVMIIVLQYYRM